MIDIEKAREKEYKMQAIKRGKGGNALQGINSFELQSKEIEWVHFMESQYSNI